MKLIIDGLIYSSNFNKTKGIRRYYDNLIPLMIKLAPDIKINFVVKDKIKLPFTIQTNKDSIVLKKIPQINLPLIFSSFVQSFNDSLAKKFWQRIDADIFHTTYYSRPLTKIPQVIVVYDMIHEKFPQYYFGKNIEIFIQNKRQVIEKADAIITISESTKKDVLKYCYVNKKKVHVIHPAVIKDFKQIRDIRKISNFLIKYRLTKPYLLYIGKRNKYKNFNLFIKAFSLWKHNKNYNMVVIEGGKWDREEKLLLNKLKIINNVLNFQDINDLDLVNFYNCAHALVIPSLYEGFGFPMLEAMACGTLVLSSNRSSLPEVGRNCAIYFNPEDADDIKRALDDSLNYSRRTQLIQKGLQRIKYFTWEKTAKQTLAVYKSLC